MGCDKPFSANDKIIVSPEPHEINPKNERIVGEFCNLRDSEGDGMTEEIVKKVTYPLSDPDHPEHKAFSESILRNVAGNDSVGDFYKENLPKALALVAEHTPDVTGLVTSSRGRGASALQKNLAHSTRGDAFAYELTGTAELVRRSETNAGPLKSNNKGPALNIDSSDRIDLGIKFQADYYDDQLNRPRGTGKYQEFRQTIEADLLVSPRDKSIPPTAVDFKHVRNNGLCKDRDSRDPQNKQPFRSQLQGIENAIKTGDIEAFHFVTNGVFDEKMKAAIEEVNVRLLNSASSEKEDNVSSNTKQRPASENIISIHEEIQYQP